MRWASGMASRLSVVGLPEGAAIATRFGPAASSAASNNTYNRISVLAAFTGRRILPSPPRRNGAAFAALPVPYRAALATRRHFRYMLAVPAGGARSSAGEHYVDIV